MDLGERGIIRTESERLLVVAVVAEGNGSGDRGGVGDAEFCRDGRREYSNDDREDPGTGWNKVEDDPSWVSRSFLPNFRAPPRPWLRLLDG